MFPEQHPMTPASLQVCSTPGTPPCPVALHKVQEMPKKGAAHPSAGCPFSGAAWPRGWAEGPPLPQLAGAPGRPCWPVVQALPRAGAGAPPDQVAQGPGPHLPARCLPCGLPTTRLTTAPALLRASRPPSVAAGGSLMVAEGPSAHQVLSPAEGTRLGSCAHLPQRGLGDGGQRGWGLSHCRALPSCLGVTRLGIHPKGLFCCH